MKQQLVTFAWQNCKPSPAARWRRSRSLKTLCRSWKKSPPPNRKTSNSSHFLASAFAVRSRLQSQNGDAVSALNSVRKAVSLVEGLVRGESAYLYDLACHLALCSSLSNPGTSGSGWRSRPACGSRGGSPSASHRRRLRRRITSSRPITPSPPCERERTFKNWSRSWKPRSSTEKK